MKNLKKVLALVLAFACAFTMFAGAAFTDAADINPDNADAVELLTTLGIIKGYEDGSFDPEGVVTRAEMAKMIYSIRNGGNDNASAHVGNTTSFTDINGHWAEGYIKYLQNTGIVAGKSATKFVPNAQVTTTEAMKMALALAGYDEKNAGLTGADWSKNTLTLATTIGLTDDVASAMSAGCSRQDAAQILANVLEATAVRYSAIVENFVNDSKTGLSYGGDPITVGYKWMDLTIYVGRMVSSGELTIANRAAGKDRFSIVVDTVNGVDATDWVWTNDYEWVSRTRTLTVKDGKDHTDLVGQEVKLLAGEKVDEVYGVYATDTSKVVETTMDKIDVERNWELTIDGETYDTRGANVYADLNAADSVKGVFTANGKAVADAVKLIDWDNDGDYETILVNTVAVAEVSYVGSSSVTLGSYGSRVKDILDDDLVLDIDDNTIYEDIAKDDYAVVTMNTYNDSWIVEKAESVSGEVNGRVANERKVCIDDVWYTLANNKVGANKAGEELYTINDSRSDFENGDDIMLVISGDIAYYAESVSGNDANRSVAMVYDTYMKGNSWNSTPQAKIILANGDKLTVDIDAIVDPTTGKEIPPEDKLVSRTTGDDKIDNLIPGKLYYYDINNDDEYTFTELGNGTYDEDAGYDVVAANNNKGVDGSRVFVTDQDVDSYTIANEAIVFAYISDEQDAEVYSGKALKDAGVKAPWGATTNGQVLADNSNGFTYARMLNVSITDDEKFNNITNYGYMVTDSIRKTLDGKNVMEYTYWNGEELVTAYEQTNANREKEIKKGAVIGFALGSDDYITDVEVADFDHTGIIGNEDVNDLELVYAAMSGYDADGYIGVVDTEGNAESYEFNGDTLAYYVKSGAANREDMGITGLDSLNYDMDPAKDGSYPINIAYILDNDGDTIKFIVIDVDGELVKDARTPATKEVEDEDIPAVPGDYNTTFATVNVDDKSVVTGAKSTLSTTGALTVDLTFASNVVKTADIRVLENGVDVTQNARLNGNPITGDEKLNGVETITLPNHRDDLDVVVEVTNIQDATIPVTVANDTFNSNFSAASVSKDCKAGDVVEIVVTRNDGSVFGSNTTYTIELPHGRVADASVKGDNTNTITFTFTLSVELVDENNKLTLTPSGISGVNDQA